MKTLFKDLTIEEVETALSELSQPRFRAYQILEWIYRKGLNNYQDMTNLPQSLRDKMESLYPLSAPTVIDKITSQDGTRKYLLSFDDGAAVETVAIPASDGRLTVCCSSQIGCAMGCIFCATGMQGFKRNLSVGEIVDQVLIVQKDMQRRISNVVMMGQGEPFANFNNTLAALRIINNQKLLNIGARRITVSTCGLVNEIGRFSEIPEQFTLAISLHSAIQSIRDRLMPSLRKETLERLRNALIQYGETTHRRVSLEYALIKNLNDSEDAFQSLQDFCNGLLCHVNLISLNKARGSTLQPVSQTVLDAWNSRLVTAGINSSIRYSRGADIAGACGQLANNNHRTP